MSDAEAMKIAEKYLKEMLQADDAADFELYTKRYESKYLKEFTREIFDNDIAGMHRRNGANQGYEFLGQLRNSTLDGLDVYRTVWKGIYEKRDAVIEMGVYKKAEQWYVIQSSVN